MNSLATRLFGAFLLIILLVTCVVGVALLILLRNNPLVERQGLARLHNVTLTVQQEGRLSPAMTPSEIQNTAERIAAAHDVRVLVTNSTGDVLIDSSPNDVPAINFARYRTGRRDLTFPGSLVGRVRDARQQPWLFVARPAGPERMLVIAARPQRWSAIVFFRENLLAPLLQAAGLAILVAVVLAIAISRSIATPLHRMAVVARSIAAGRYGELAPVSGPDEVRALGASLNSMAQQVQATQAAQRNFLANVSHELKTPLTSIQGFAQAMLDGAVTTSDGVQRAANIIHSEADRMRRLVDSLLDLARLDAGLRTLQRASVDIRSLLAGVVDKFSLPAAAKNVTLKSDLQTTWPAMAGDADRLAQVFTNLLDNALRHTPSGGTIAVTAAISPAAVDISVTDTGPGISPDDQNRIFERFYQVDKSRARSAGLGLGLAITKDIVEAHGGRITVQNQPAGGACFTVTLPATRPGEVTLARKRRVN